MTITTTNSIWLLLQDVVDYKSLILNTKTRYAHRFIKENRGVDHGHASERHKIDIGIVAYEYH